MQRRNLVLLSVSPATLQAHDGPLCVVPEQVSPSLASLFTRDYGSPSDTFVR